MVLTDWKCSKTTYNHFKTQTMLLETDNIEATPKSDIKIAGLFLRLAAMVYDFFLIAALWFLIAGLVVIINGGEAPPLWISRYLLFPALIAATLGFNIWFWTHGGQSLGMRAWRIKVVDQAGETITFHDGLKRSFFAVFSLAFFGAGYFWILIDKQKSSWHDRWSNTCVLRLPAS